MRGHVVRRRAPVPRHRRLPPGRRGPARAVGPPAQPAPARHAAAAGLDGGLLVTPTGEKDNWAPVPWLAFPGIVVLVLVPP